MKLRLNRQLIIIVVIAAVGISGVIEALPHAKESTRDLAIDGGLLLLIVALSAVFVNIRATLIRRRKPPA